MGSNEYLVVRIGIIIKRVFVVSKLHVEFYAPFALILLFFLSCESDLCFLIILKTRIKMLIIPFYLRIKLSEIIFNHFLFTLGCPGVTISTASVSALALLRGASLSFSTNGNSSLSALSFSSYKCGSWQYLLKKIQTTNVLTI